MRNVSLYALLLFGGLSFPSSASAQGANPFQKRIVYETNPNGRITGVLYLSPLQQAQRQAQNAVQMAGLDQQALNFHQQQQRQAAAAWYQAVATAHQQQVAQAALARSPRFAGPDGYHGTITQIEAKRRYVTVDLAGQPRPIIFALNRDAALTLNGDQATLADLRPGDTIDLHCERGVKVAHTVAVKGRRPQPVNP